MGAPPQKIVGFPGRAVARDDSRLLPARFVLRLQQTVGNREVVRLLAPRPVPPMALVHSPSTLPVHVRPASRMERVAAWWRRLWRRPT